MESQSVLTLLEAAVLIAAMVFAARLIRRHIRDHHQNLVEWWMRAVMPRARRWLLWLSLATMVLWIIVQATAPDGARRSLSDQLQHLQQLFRKSIPSSKDAAPGNTTPDGATPPAPPTQ